MILYKVEKAEMMLSRMNVPVERKIITPSNAFWLLGNIRDRNVDHPDLEEVTVILKEIVYRDRVL